MTDRPVPPAAGDVSSMIGALRARGVFCCSTRMSPGWRLDLPSMPGTVMFHVVLHGTGQVSTDGRASQVRRGDVAVAAHGTGHTLATGNTDRVSLERAPRREIGEGFEVLDLVGSAGQAVPEPVLHTICGALALEHPAAPPFPRVLPALSVLSPTAADGDRTLALTDLLLDEATSGRPGWIQVTRSLADALAMRAFRAMMDDVPAGHGWWSGIHDARLLPVLEAVYADPGHPWSVEELARLAHLSRSVFSARFRACLGTPPMQWVTQHRMRLAHAMLRQGDPVSTAARRVGYESEFAFRRAFHATTGTTPGAVRRAAEPAPTVR